MRPTFAFARLTTLLFLLGLSASRAGVVIHELAGHYGVARLFGCSLTELRLFLFGGGFVDYACSALSPAQHLATDLGGIAVQVGAGMLLAIGAARWSARPLLGLLVAGTSALFVLHGLFYLVTGVHYGVGDGRALHVLLAEGRRVPVALGSAGLVLLCFAAARQLAARLAPWLPDGSAGRRVAIAGVAMLAATALHGAAFLAEQRVLADATYAATFRPEPAIEVDRALRRFESEQPRAPEAVAAQRRILEERLAPFPLRPLLGAGMTAAALAGSLVAFRRDPRPAPAVDRAGALLRAAAICALAQALVVALDRGF